jgi:hypothetical protein
MLKNLEIMKMKKKSVSIFILTLLMIIATLPLVGSTAEKTENLVSSYTTLPESSFPVRIVTDISDMVGNVFKNSAGLEITIKNIGDETINDIEWTFSATGGIIIFGDGEHGSIPTSMRPEDDIRVILRPAPGIFPDADGQSPIGIGLITMTATAQGTIGSTLESDSTTADAFLLGPFILMNRI